MLLDDVMKMLSCCWGLLWRGPLQNLFTNLQPHVCDVRGDRMPFYSVLLCREAVVVCVQGKSGCPSRGRV